jgi:hypothetical protein
MFHKEVKTSYSKKHKQRVGPPLLGEADMIGHKGEGKGRRKGNGRGKVFRQEIKHGNGEDSKDQRNNSEVSFWLCKWIEDMGQNKK